MPEEINRILSDHLSDRLFAPTLKAKEILLGEGVEKEKIFVTGNTIVDAVYQNLELAEGEQDILKSLHLKPEGYFLVTMHRQENVDNPARLASILAGLSQLVTQYQIPVIYPAHPRSRKKMSEFVLEPQNLTVIEPVGFFSFIQLESKAKLVLTDSGGVQEEACILGVPCVTIRDNTERPETLEVGASILAGASADRIVECVRVMLGKDRNWQNPFGDGRAAERICGIITGNNGG